MSGTATLHRADWTSRQQARAALYLQIADDLRTAIGSGQYAAGTVLPGERRLAGRFDVSRDVVREALRVLAGEGLIHKGPLGHVVSPEPEPIPVVVPDNAVVIARMPSPEERRRLDIDHDTGVPVLVVQVEGRPAVLYAADRTVLHYTTPATDPPS